MQKEVIHIREWYTDTEIKKEHKDFSVRQVTCFVMSKDQKLLLVSKNGQKWSVTAGHYEAQKDSKYIETALREVYEESGLDISKYADDVEILGYCVIKDVEKNSSLVVDTYLQIRTFLSLDKDSKEITLKPMEEDLVKYAKFFTIRESMKLIKWLQDSDEWKTIKEIIK